MAQFLKTFIDIACIGYQDSRSSCSAPSTKVLYGSCCLNVSIKFLTGNIFDVLRQQKVCQEGRWRLPVHVPRSDKKPQLPVRKISVQLLGPENRVGPVWSRQVRSWKSRYGQMFKNQPNIISTLTNDFVAQLIEQLCLTQEDPGLNPAYFIKNCLFTAKW